MIIGRIDNLLNYILYIELYNFISVFLLLLKLIWLMIDHIFTYRPVNAFLCIYQHHLSQSSVINYHSHQLCELKFFIKNFIHNE